MIYDKGIKEFVEAAIILKKNMLILNLISMVTLINTILVLFLFKH